MPHATFAVSVPTWWYVAAAVPVVTLVWILLSKPRKKSSDSGWRG